MEKVFYDGWEVLVRTLIVGVLIYPTLIFSLRISGKRTLSKMNAFDLVVTVSLGSTLASILLNKDVTLAQGGLAFVILIGFQFLVTWTSVRVRWVRRLVTGEPHMLYGGGQFIKSVLRLTRVTEDEVRAAVRAQGLSHFGGVEAVILETDGSFSVVKKGSGEGPSSLSNVQSGAR